MKMKRPGGVATGAYSEWILPSAGPNPPEREQPRGPIPNES
jgi:hypothetical protein